MTQARIFAKPIEKRLCPKCGSEDMSYVSSGKYKGQSVRYYDCESCFTNWRQCGEVYQARLMGNRRGYIRQEGIIKGARVFIDGKFMGVGK